MSLSLVEHLLKPPVRLEAMFQGSTWPPALKAKQQPAIFAFEALATFRSVPKVSVQFIYD